MQPCDNPLASLVQQLATRTPDEEMVLHSCHSLPPSRESIARILDMVKAILFPEFFGTNGESRVREYYIGVLVHQLHTQLHEQLQRVQADAQLMPFLSSLPELKRLLYTDIKAIYHNDPAVVDYGEVIACYPVVQAMIHHRVAHCLLQLGVPIIPRIISELAHSETGIDIHPGATIGEYFAIDHGTGVVIGETCIIGHHVTLYQGVTLGAKNFTYDADGHPLNVARHPILEDYVTVYSNASILGRITIGHHSTIGGNVWLTHPVPPHSTILQSRNE